MNANSGGPESHGQTPYTTGSVTSLFCPNEETMPLQNNFNKKSKEAYILK